MKFNFFKNIFKKESEEEPTAPHSRGYVVFTDSARWKGTTKDDTTKIIQIFEGNEIIREYPYDKILAEKIELVEKIPIDDLTLEHEEIETDEEIEPADLNFER